MPALEKIIVRRDVIPFAALESKPLCRTVVIVPGDKFDGRQRIIREDPSMRYP
jgi:hypothetical protein